MKYAILMTIAVICQSFGSGAIAEERIPASKPLIAVSGADSHVRRTSYRRITKPNDWQQLWASHLGTSQDDAYRPKFEVDFDRCLLVVIFLGEQTNVRGVEVTSITDGKNSIVLRFHELTYQTSGSSNDDPPDRPYAFVVVPSTSKGIVLEQGFRSLKNDEEEFREVARI